MHYYYSVVFTIILLILFTLAALSIDYISKVLQKHIKPKYLNTTVILILLSLMISGTYVISLLGNWKFIDTIFISSLCLFGLGWITNITSKASTNSQGTVAKFLTNNDYEHQYEAASSPEMSLYFISSLIFFVGSWGISFLLAFM
ncbi:hypothetical protein FZC76_14335 [Sutcliffiella horikoshii]|uniref:Uncharacterized protein n=1 Tax=Sutcliffiella horikoshii TaxID=79883 RepID=A0A5D4SZI5_9BACI|nr:hypothetical protein [Sutcliffiella horikoshii]TYS67738.1 hypothetical protein FZC76_14335 [Sutcliffiella horikoshii]